ncbi:MAG: nucleotidyl transferase AbiEii/AbiGii toxin family protein [Candidatus Symbiothrix sp.]|jgi:predicted nucleotidyltransferase component of viral defense system|nr:nucleotidyl transferase AbiEii/AbiGii toxin family protein [Candidatus Symbiothrix sp.]
MTWIELPNENKLKVLEEVRTRTGFPLFIIEKDWWVVQTLRLITHINIAQYTVFKGGTSLSKAWGLIDRFSEDIDLAINREFFGFSGDISRTQVGKLKDASSKYISNDFLFLLQKTFDDAGFNDVHLAVTDEKAPDDDPVKIEVRYPTVTPYSAYVQPRVLLEIGSRSMIEPTTIRSFRSMIGETFSNLPFADENIQIRCVNPERTFLEKLFLLHEEHQRPKEKMKIKGKSRHFYDIYRIAQTEYADKAIADNELYKSIVAHRKRFSKLGGVDYTSHFPPNLNPVPPAELMPEWERDYAEIQGQMIVGENIQFKELIKRTLSTIEMINEKWH